MNDFELKIGNFTFKGIYIGIFLPFGTSGEFRLVLVVTSGEFRLVLVGLLGFASTSEVPFMVKISLTVTSSVVTMSTSDVSLGD